MTPIARYIAEKEGYRDRAYHCSEGYPTIGYGYKLSKTKWVDLSAYSAMVISEQVAAVMLQEKIVSIISDRRMADHLQGLIGARKAALVSMAYQLGIHGLLKFKRMLAALELRDYDQAAAEAMDSLWAEQTPSRAEETAKMIMTGEWP
jgi:lysozyme